MIFFGHVGYRVGNKVGINCGKAGMVEVTFERNPEVVDAIYNKYVAVTLEVVPDEAAIAAHKVWPVRLRKD